MKFEDLDTRMRVYETAHDLRVLPGLFMVARLDGRNFTRLTSERHPFEHPFDSTFRDLMLATTEHLMTCGFNMLYGYTQSDEISLLFHPQETSFGRKLRKLISVLAGEASAKFSLLLGDVASFDCRISQLPTADLVADYFRWRNEDAHRNALNAHCYWGLRQNGNSASEATTALLSLSVAQKNEMLYQRGVNFNDLPQWQRRGSGLFWKHEAETGIDPRTKQTVTTMRRRIQRDLSLPMREAYAAYVLQILTVDH